MKPAWDELGSDYEASSVVIGDVDCTEHAALCQEYGVSGYPTVKYFTSEGPQAYSGGRDLPSLKKFVEETLETKCDVNEPSNCSEKEQKFIDVLKVRGWSNSRSHFFVLPCQLFCVMLFYVSNSVLI